jgi:hypothetical protein
MFLEWEDDTIPQPGAFSVVFDAERTMEVFENEPPLREFSEAYAEALSTEYPGTGILDPFPSWDGVAVAKEVVSTTYAAASVKLRPDAVCGGDVFGDPSVDLPTELSEFISSLGPIAGEPGDSWELFDQGSTSRAFARASLQMGGGHTPLQAMDKFWLPTSQGDERYKLIIATRVIEMVRDLGVVTNLRFVLSRIFSTSVGNRWSSWGLPQTTRDVLRVFEDPCHTPQEFYLRFGRGDGFRSLEALRLKWPIADLVDVVPVGLERHVLLQLNRWRGLVPHLQTAIGMRVEPTHFLGGGDRSQLLSCSFRRSGVLVKAPFNFSMSRWELTIGLRPGTVFMSKEAVCQAANFSVPPSHYVQRVIRGGSLI